MTIKIHTHPVSAKMHLELSKDMFVALYKGCQDRQEKLQNINKTTDDEDEAADAGNDLVYVTGLIKTLEREADNTWGEGNWIISQQGEYL